MGLTIDEAISDSTKSKDNEEVSKRIAREIQAYERKFKPYYTRRKEIVRRYRDEGEDNAAATPTAEIQGRFNVLWSNSNIMLAALYDGPASAVAERRGYQNDRVARLSAQILQRATNYECEQYNYEQVNEDCLFDFVLSARGQAWVKYKPTMESVRVDLLLDSANPMFDEDDNAIPSLVYADGVPYDGDISEVQTDSNGPYVMKERVVREEVIAEYVHPEDFGHNCARRWEGVETVWRKHRFSQSEIKEKWPKYADKIPVNEYEDTGESERPSEQVGDKACVYEVWHKPTRTVYHYVKSVGIIDSTPDPLKLREFFPCPMPLYGTITTDDLRPEPDYKMWQDQATLLDSLSARTRNIAKQLAVRGCYNSAIPELIQLFSETPEQHMVGIRDWAGFQQAGGINGGVEMFDLTALVKNLESISALFSLEKARLDEISGVSDVLRGQTDRYETAAAQNAKVSFATRRLRRQGRKINRFFRDLIRLKAEIIAEHFSEESLWMSAGVEMMPPDDQEIFGQAVALLKNDVLRNYRIDVETDRSIEQDDASERQQANQFLQTVGSYMNEAIKVLGAAPTMAPAIGELLMYVVRRYRAGREMEGVIERSVDATIQYVEQRAANPQPDPKLIRANASIELDRQKLETNAALRMQQMEIDKQALALDQLSQEQDRTVELIKANAKG